MNLEEQKRCFQCGATYPAAEQVCTLDDSPLSYDIINRRWRIERLLGKRPGGGIFSAFHLVSGARAVVDLVCPPFSEDPLCGGRLKREAAALKILENHPQIPKLLEHASYPNGTLFLVSESLEQPPLSALLEEWSHPRRIIPLAKITEIILPLLTILHGAHKLGIRHGALSAPWIYLGSLTSLVSMDGPAQKPKEGGSRSAKVILRGLQVLELPTKGKEAGGMSKSTPPQLVQADLKALSLLLLELSAGSLDSSMAQPPKDRINFADEPVKRWIEEQYGPRLVEALGSGLAGEFADAEAYSQALFRVLSPTVQIGTQKLSALMPIVRGNRLASTLQTGIVPPALEPLAPLSLPRAGLTSELRQVSLTDLMEDTHQTHQSETLAASRDRPFVTDQLQIIRMGPRAEPSLEIEVLMDGIEQLPDEGDAPMEEEEVEVRPGLTIHEPKPAEPVADSQRTPVQVPLAPVQVPLAPVQVLPPFFQGQVQAPFVPISHGGTPPLPLQVPRQPLRAPTQADLLFAREQERKELYRLLGWAFLGLIVATIIGLIVLFGLRRQSALIIEDADLHLDPLVGIVPAISGGVDNLVCNVHASDHPAKGGVLPIQERRI